MYRCFGITLIFLLAACTQVPIQQTPIETQANYWQEQGGVVGIGHDADLASDGISNTIAFPELNGSVYDIRVAKWDGASWNSLGLLSGSSAPASDAYQPSVQLDSAGLPVVVWAEKNSIKIQRFNGSSWVNLDSGSVLSSSNVTECPSLVLNNAGLPVVAWKEVENGDPFSVHILVVARFNGVIWEYILSTVGISTDDLTNVECPSIALDNTGQPIIAWSEPVAGSQNIYIQRFDGTNWVNVGSGILGGSSASPIEPSLIVDSTGNPIVAWSEFEGSNRNIYVQRFNGSTWANVGTSISASNASNSWAHQPALGLNSSGQPVVAWHEFDGTSKNIYVRQFNGSSWVNAGFPLDTTLSNNAFTPSLSLVNGNLSVAWKEASDEFNPGNIHVKRYVTNAWQDLGNELDFTTAQDSTNSAIAIKGNNLPVVAWSEIDATNSSRNIHVKEWTGSSWNKVGLGPLDRNVLNVATNPSIAMRNDDRPVVAWNEGYPNANVYVKRWSGTTWVNVGGAVEATLSGSTTAIATNPSIALDSANLPVVAYVENGNILVKRANGVVGTSSWLSPYGTTPLDQAETKTAYAPKLALKSDDNPIVAWYENSGTSLDIHVKEWIGTTWIFLGTVIETNLANDARDIVLAIGSDNNPVVAWGEAGHVRVKRWDGSAWIPLGGVVDKVAANQASIPSIDLRTDNNPVVSWQEWNGANYDVWVKRWNGTRWALVSTPAIDKVLAQSAGSPSIVLKTNSNPIVSWQEFDGASNNVYVKQF